MVGFAGNSPTPWIGWQGVSYAGQVVMRGFIGRGVPLFARRAITMLPALIALAAGLPPTATLVTSQVVLSFGIPFALVPLVALTRRADIMGPLVNRPLTTCAAAGTTGIIITLNGCLLAVTLLHQLRPCEDPPTRPQNRGGGTMTPPAGRCCPRPGPPAHRDQLRGRAAPRVLGPGRQRIDAVRFSVAISHAGKRRVLLKVQLRTLAGCPAKFAVAWQGPDSSCKTTMDAEYDGHGTA
jgi:hypothetical protein